MGGGYVREEVNDRWKRIGRWMVLSGGLLAGLFCLVNPVPVHTQSAGALQESSGIRTEKFGTLRTTFFSDILPCKWEEASFLALTLNTDGAFQLPSQPESNGLNTPYWLTFFKGGRSKVGQLRVGNYEFPQYHPRVVTTEEDIYIFFLSGVSDLRDATPVARHTPGGWAWQTLDTVETEVRRKVYDLAACFQQMRYRVHRFPIFHG